MPDAAFIEDVLQSSSAGVLIGSIYWPMCAGLALIFGAARRASSLLPAAIS
jgi:hypothetical protein